MSSLYAHFKDRLDPEKLSSARRSSGTREASIVLVENKGGDPLLGIQYACDFRSEEETGAGEMAKTFTQASDPKSFFAREYLLQEGNQGLNPNFTQAELIFDEDGLIGFAAKTRIWDPKAELKRAAEWLKTANSWKDGRSKIQQKYWYSTVPELKALAKSRGLKGYSKLNRAELEKLAVDYDYAALHAGDAFEETLSQPGWFHYGTILVFEKKNTLFTEVLLKLVEAAEAGRLVAGGGGVGFGSGFSFFDSRDLTAEAEAEISENNRWYREQMELLKPVAAVVKEGPMKNSWGSAYYFLGSPGLNGEGQVRYWLNGSSVKFPNGLSAQPSGWYTLQELLDEKYMEDAKVRSDEDVKRISGGHYRKAELTDAEAEAELKAKGLKWASKPMAGA